MSDIESDDDIPELAMSPSGNLINGQNFAGGGVLDDDRRAHHNALERKRRDHIKDSFSMLREVVPTFEGRKSKVNASRALILKKAAEYIYSLKTNINGHQKDISHLKQQNALLEAELNVMESQEAEQKNSHENRTLEIQSSPWRPVSQVSGNSLLVDDGNSVVVDGEVNVPVPADHECLLRNSAPKQSPTVHLPPLAVSSPKSASVSVTSPVESATKC